MPPPLRSSLLDCRSLHGKAGNAPRPVYYATPQSKGTTAFRCAPVGVKARLFHNGTAINATVAQMLQFPALPAGSRMLRKLRVPWPFRCEALY